MFPKEVRSKISAVLTFVLLFSMLVPAMAFGATAVQLKDIADSYAQKEIQALVDSGIISGYEDGSFQPDKAMTRAELAKIIVLSQGLKENPDKASTFTDVDKNSWYRGFVGALVESKITEGTSATTFSPDAKVTREELVVFFVRAMGLEKAAGKLAVDAELSDLSQVSSWAQAHVSLAFKIGFVNGIEDGKGGLKFSPKDSAERQALARLAYEFKTNKDKFVAKTKELTDVVTELAVSSVTAVSSTSVEVTFNKGITSVDKADFTFDNNLTVTKAELKADSETVVVLTTSTQTADKVYKLSYKGKDTGVTLTGYSAAGGGGGSSSSRNDRPTVSQILNGGTAYNGNVTINSGGTFGPASGKTTINGTLTLNPGPTGEITLQNVDANEIVVASGSENSIKLMNTVIKQLRVAATGQTNPVRIETLKGADVTNTQVESQAIVESTEGGFGTITIGSGAANKTIQLRGTITGAVYVNAPSTITLAPPKDSGNKPTTISNLRLGANATISAGEGTTLSSLSIVAPNTTATFAAGKGVIKSVTVTGDAKGSTLQLNSGTNIRGITVNTEVTLAGDADAVGSAPVTVGNGGKVSANNSLKDALKGKAIADIAKLGNIQEYSKEIENQIIAAEIVANNAILLGVSESEITGYLTVLAHAKTKITELALEAAYRDLAIGYAGNDNESGVTQNITLPTYDAARGVSISWKSSNTSVVSDSGVVTRPAAGQPDAQVTLTATISKNGKDWDITFIITVLAQGSIAATGYHVFGDIYLDEVTRDGVLVQILDTNGGTVAEATYGDAEGTTSVGKKLVTSNGSSNIHYYFDLPNGTYKIKASKDGRSSLKEFTTNSTDVYEFPYAKLYVQQIGNLILYGPSTNAGTITGYVYGTNNTVISGALVTVTGTTGSSSTHTNSSGMYTIPNVPVGTYNLSVTEAAFYNNGAASSVVVTASGVTTQNITLTPVLSSSVTSAVYYYASNNGAVSAGTVLGSVYGKDAALGNSASNRFNIPNSYDHLIIKFSENLSTTVNQNTLTVTSNGTVIPVTSAVYENVYLSIRPTTQLQAQTNYTIVLNGLKLSSGQQAQPVTIYVYKEQ